MPFLKMHFLDKIKTINGGLESNYTWTTFVSQNLYHPT